MLSYINKNWSIARRLTVIAILGLIPCAPLLYGVVAGDLADIETAKRELGGIEAQKKVWAFMNAAEHGSAGDKASELKSIATLYPQEFSIVADADRMIATRDPVVRAKIGAQMMEGIAAGSGLTLDPEAASYFLMEIVSLRNAALRHQLVAVEEQMRQQAGAGPLDSAGFAHLSIMVHKVLGILQVGERLKAANETTGKQITPLLLPLQNFKRWHDQLENSSKLDANVVRSDVRPLRDAVEKIWQIGHVELQKLLSDRIDRKWGDAAWLAGIVVVFAVFALVLAILLARAFARTLSHQIEVLDRLSRDDDSVKLNCEGYQNESRAISDALLRMKYSLTERRRLASESDQQVADKEALNVHYAEAHEIFMKEFRSAAERLAAGDFQHPITAIVIDEYREIVDVMNATFQQLDRVQTSIKAADSQRDEAIAAVGEALSKLAEGDLSARIDAGLAREFGKLEADFNTAVQQLELTIGEVKSNANSIKQGIDEISVASDDLSRRTENQAATLEQTSAAVAEITMAVAKTSDGASHANTVVTTTKADAVHSGEIVANAIVAMAAIEKSSQQISQIIGVIDEIAFQTNLLALNAGVEAARAGEAGRGFAVVASEVRALAQRSAEAAKQIKGLISTSSKEVTTGVTLVGETGRALKRIVEQVGAVSTAVAEIAASAKQQSIGLSQVNTAVSQMDQVTQQNAAMVEEATAATRGLKQQTEELSAQIERFKTSNRGMSEALHSMSGRMAAAAKPRESFAKGKTAKVKIAAGASGTKRLAVANDGWEEF